MLDWYNANVSPEIGMLLGAGVVGVLVILACVVVRWWTV